jgi:hypothetical protein
MYASCNVLIVYANTFLNGFRVDSQVGALQQTFGPSFGGSNSSVLQGPNSLSTFGVKCHID